MSATARRVRILAATSTPLVVAMLLSACSTSPSPSIAHAEEPATHVTSSARPTPDDTSAQAKFQAFLASERAYAMCMRGIGLNVTDPEPDGSLKALYKEQLNNGGLTAEQNAGIQRCQAKILPDPRPEAYPTMSDEEFAFETKMASCMRSHGVPGYPDPVRESDPALPSVKHYQAAVEALASGTQAYQTALDDCSVAISGHKGNG